MVAPSSRPGGVQPQSRSQSREEFQQEMQQHLTDYIQHYHINLGFPAKIVPSKKNSKKKLRTNHDLIQVRLLEAGVTFHDDDVDDDGNPQEAQRLGPLTEAVQAFVQDLNRSNAYHSVQVLVDHKPIASNNKNSRNKNRKGLSKQQQQQSHKRPTQQQLQVVLDEKNWYRLYIGGGIKQDFHHMGGTSGGGGGGGDPSGILPAVQFETTASLNNLMGHLDHTSLSYTVDQTSTSTLSLIHERPLYSFFLPTAGKSVNLPGIYDWILSQPHGSKTTLQFRGILDTVNYEYTRSYQELQRIVGMRLSNIGHVIFPEAAQRPYTYLDWSLNFRDVMPRRHAHLPYAMDASPQVVSEAGPSLKHSLVYEHRSNRGDFLCASRNNNGDNNDFNDDDDDDDDDDGLLLDYFTRIEAAGPPGNVGFFKIQGGIQTTFSNFLSSSSLLSLHASLQGGYLKPMSFGGLCNNNNDTGSTGTAAFASRICDRFFLCGPLPLRGFCPAGVGPRSQSFRCSGSGGQSPGGDSLGGESYYAATLAASIPLVSPHAVMGVSQQQQQQQDNDGSGGDPRQQIQVVQPHPLSGLRAFCFTSLGSCCGSGTASSSSSSSSSYPLPTRTVQSLLETTRISVGGGLCMATSFGRLEATYAVPLRYGPRDARRAVQVGLGFHFG